jgi:hypothetical protein
MEFAMIKKNLVLALCTGMLLSTSNVLLAEEDSYEREADNVADTVMSRPAPVTRETGNTSSSATKNQSQQMQGAQQLQKSQGLKSAPAQLEGETQGKQYQMR